jgi:hypothetical protein
MEIIKERILKNLDDITEVFDYNDLSDQYLTLNSKYTHDKEVYELSVEVLAKHEESYNEGNYHSNWGMHEGSGVVSKIIDVEILNVYFLQNDSDSDFEVSREEILNSIKY